MERLDPRQQAALIDSKRPGDIARQQEQLDILRGILEERGSDMTDNETPARYLADLGQLVKEMAREAKLDRDAAVGGPEQDIKLGKLMAWHEIVSLMQQQAQAFGIDLRELALSDVDPERDLV